MKVTLACCLAVLCAGAVVAAGQPPSAASGVSQAAGADAEECLFCHAADTLYVRLPGDEVLHLTVDLDEFASSVHGQADLTCTDCHRDYQGYPHPDAAYASLRDFQLTQYTLCRGCHEAEYEDALDSTHQRALAGGREDAAICTDCHGAHDIQTPNEPRSRIPQTCRQCHSTIYDQYADSVHGEALLDESNPDVPTCVDCHGVHSIAGPPDTDLRLLSPQICGECHADPERMSPYGISTDVVDTYVADFHGTIVTIFASQPGGQLVNEAVCTDCHGVHDIVSVDDPSSPVIRENLLATCQQCHPSAGEHFTAAWASHYSPSREHHPIVYYVDEFYKTLLPAAGLLIVVVVAADVVDWLRGGLRGEGR